MNLIIQAVEADLSTSDIEKQEIKLHSAKSITRQMDGVIEFVSSNGIVAFTMMGLQYTLFESAPTPGTATESHVTVEYLLNNHGWNTYPDALHATIHYLNDQGGELMAQNIDILVDCTQRTADRKPQQSMPTGMIDLIKKAKFTMKTGEVRKCEWEKK